MDDRIVLACAELAHEANRIYCAAIGDHTQKPWSEAEFWQQQSAIDGVKVALGGATPGQQHQAWMADKIADGWTLGAVKDPKAKTHPCLVPYQDLPQEQRAKDSLYQGVVRAMANALGSL